MSALLVILDRKEFELRLAGMYWTAPLADQMAFLRRAGYLVPDAWEDGADPGEIRQAISTAVAQMGDVAFGALAQHELMEGVGA